MSSLGCTEPYRVRSGALRRCCSDGLTEWDTVCKTNRLELIQMLLEQAGLYVLINAGIDIQRSFS